ncbi:MAG TPA: TIR domain-containing protein [Thermoanaerobaculia bacterium]|jgi:hypothetical protein|nr:TIR domain-containing protein [Thermoanaerobaculia bacterium]
MPPQSTAPAGDRPTVFLSYSHKDETWKDRVATHLKVLEPQGVLEPWDDRQILGGDDWLAKIQQAMDRASVAVLLVSADSLGSSFILETEVPYLLQRQKTDGLRIIALIVRPCAWKGVPWLASIGCRPKDGQPLSGGTEYQVEEALTALVLEIQDHLGTASKPRRLSRASRFDLTRLPAIGLEFVGRETEMDRLDAAWDDPSTHVVTLVAFGGVGKSALVSRWLGRRAAAGWPGVRSALDWSFFSQGTGERVASADPFLDHALRFFGDPDPTAGSSRDRGVRLADLVRREKTLLVLDGIEPLQYPPGPLAGRLKDPGLSALLNGLAVGNPGLCLVTTREHISDLNNFAQTAPQWDLEHLTLEAGATLLRRLGVKGKDSELLTASKEMDGHALALTLLGNFLRRACGGDVRRRKEVDLGDADERQGGRAFQVIRAYARWLEEGPELAILRLLGLFDRPADAKALEALRAKPSIPGLTETLVDISAEESSWAISSLQEHGLLLSADPHHATPGEEAEAELARSAERLDYAVEGLRQAAQELYVPRGLLARAAFRRLRGDRAGAKADLAESLEIAERGSMRLHACDAHLEWARLCLQQGDTGAARVHAGVARKIVDETKYGRREREVRWLERAFMHRASPREQGEART